MKKLYSLLLLTALSAFSISESKAQCSANFSTSTSGNTATFTDFSTAGFGSVVTWGWSFGDGAFSGSQNPVHTYASCGVYNVSLTIGTTAFCTNTFSAHVTVNGGITPSYTYTIDTTNGNTTFQPTPLGLNLNYVWSFGDGIFDSTTFPSHTYPTGTYTACLTVTDDSNICSATFCDTLMVYVAPPTCSTTFITNQNTTGGATFQVSPFNFNMTYNWDFGDGTTGTGGFTTHNYPASGTYIACLTAVDSATMCSSHSCDTLVFVQDTTACNVAFNNFDNNGQVGFIVNSTAANNSYSWNFGDGNTGTGAATSNTYSASGTYYVCLTTTNSFNFCTATFCDSVVVVIAGILEQSQANFMLNAYPNPVNDLATISYMLQKDAEVQIVLTDLPGKTISVIESGTRAHGKHQTTGDMKNFANGIYLLQIKVDGRMETKKIVISK